MWASKRKCFVFYHIDLNGDVVELTGVNSVVPFQDLRRSEGWNLEEVRRMVPMRARGVVGYRVAPSWNDAMRGTNLSDMRWVEPYEDVLAARALTRLSKERGILLVDVVGGKSWYDQLAGEYIGWDKSFDDTIEAWPRELADALRGIEDNMVDAW